MKRKKKQKKKKNKNKIMKKNNKATKSISRKGLWGKRPQTL